MLTDASDISHWQNIGICKQSCLHALIKSFSKFFIILH